MGQHHLKQYVPRLQKLRQERVNFDPRLKDTFTEGNGWRLSDYEIDLPPEPPGPPLENGSFAIAKQILHNYEFPDTTLIEAIFDPDEPLHERTMLLIGKFAGMKFYFGGRVNGVIDEQRQTEDGPAHVWGYGYQTLESHWENGEITFEIWKYLNSGRVKFRFHSYVRIGYVPNWLYRVGFRMMWKRLQVQFARTALARMRSLVMERLEKL
ncbi:MAG: DUF1990 domain-containing protein [Chloroflexi bacterium]|nr:DUF1990 domain-containing protein [Chloroflexota bacterium]